MGEAELLASVLVPLSEAVLAPLGAELPTFAAGLLASGVRLLAVEVILFIKLGDLGRRARS